MSKQVRMQIEVTVTKGDGGWAEWATVTAGADGVYMDFTEQPLEEYRLLIKAEDLRDLSALVKFCAKLDTKT